VSSLPAEGGASSRPSSSLPGKKSKANLKTKSKIGYC
jgi:hypothetical protein